MLEQLCSLGNELIDASGVGFEAVFQFLVYLEEGRVSGLSFGQFILQSLNFGLMPVQLASSVLEGFCDVRVLLGKTMALDAGDFCQTQTRQGSRYIAVQQLFGGHC